MHVDISLYNHHHKNNYTGHVSPGRKEGDLVSLRRSRSKQVEFLLMLWDRRRRLRY